MDAEEGGARDGVVNHGVYEGGTVRAVRLLKAGSLLADTVLVVRTEGGTVKVSETVEDNVEEATVIRDDIGAEIGGGVSSRISKIEASREEVSEAFLFILVTRRGLPGVPLQGCAL